ncbi:pyrimidine/purine nucleoside phosphorylase [Candidatus Thioglobus sp.]|nr:pyrimidine/purine nucleoside phosphorylase [Candidatus Thioglobus sp.]
MATFKNVEISKEANIYFDGKVTSRKVKFTDGVVKTLGIMMPGSFEFGTEQDELMEITAGEMNVLLAGKTEWQTIQGGESFEVPANSSFKLEVKSVVDYCCSYS